MTQTAIVFKKLASLEQEVQRLKVQAYLNLPKTKQVASLYSQAALTKALRATRNQLWQRRYAKKVKSLS